MLACVPSMVVVRVGPEETMSPFRLQVMERGKSPWLMTQVNWANLPWSIVSKPNENGTISGFSVNKTFQCLPSILPFTNNSAE